MTIRAIAALSLITSASTLFRRLPVRRAAL